MESFFGAKLLLIFSIFTLGLVSFSFAADSGLNAPDKNCKLDLQTLGTPGNDQYNNQPALDQMAESMANQVFEALRTQSVIDLREQQLKTIIDSFGHQEKEKTDF